MIIYNLSSQACQKIYSATPAGEYERRVARMTLQQKRYQRPLQVQNCL